METFVRKDFYIKPPEDNKPESWAAWLKADSAKARSAKVQHTRAVNIIAEANGELGDNAQEHRESVCRKINGTYRQVSPIAFVGNFEEGDGHIEPMVDSDSEKVIIMSRWVESKRGTKSKHRSARRRANMKRS